MEGFVVLLPLTVLCVGLTLLVISKGLAGGTYSAHISLISALLGFVSVIYIWYLSRSHALQLELVGWSPVSGHPFSLLYRVDSWSTLFAGISLATVLAALLLRARLSSVIPHRGAWGDVPLLGLGVTFINLVFAASTISLVASWILLGLVVYAGSVVSSDSPEDRDSAQSALVMSCISGSLLLGVAVAVGRKAGYIVSLDELGPDQVSLSVFVLLILALAAYAGLFPFHFWATELGSLPSSFAAPSAILTSLASVYVLGKFRYVIDGNADRTFSILLIAVGFSSVAYGAISAWAEPDFRRLLRYLAMVELGYAFAAFGIGSPAAVTAAILMVVNLALSGGAVALYVLELRSRGIGGESSLISRSPLELGLALLACASLVGAPPLLGFFARWMLYSAAIEAGFGILAFLGFAVSCISIVPFLRSVDHLVFTRSDLGWHHPELHSVLSLSAVGILQLPSLAIGLLPWVTIEHVIGPAADAASSNGIGSLSAAVPASASMFVGFDHADRLLALVAALAVTVPLGIAARLYPFPLGRTRLNISYGSITSQPARTHDLLDGIRFGLEIAALSLFRTLNPRLVLLALGNTMEWIGTTLHIVSARVEERYYLPTLLMLGIATVFVFLS